MLAQITTFIRCLFPMTRFINSSGIWLLGAYRLLGMRVNSASNINVAIIDSGYDLSHSDLQGVAVAGYDFCGRVIEGVCNYDSNVAPDGSTDTHGTHNLRYYCGAR